VSLTNDQTIVRRKKNRVEHHAELIEAVGERVGAGSVELARVLATVEGLRVLPLAEVARQLGISKSTVKRSFAHLLVRVGERRVGMKLKDVLELVKPA
jgi:AraC-like DNA-binding protein